MKKQVALVTGGMGGLGEAMSIKLYDAGYSVVVTCSTHNTGADRWLERMETQRRQFRAYTVDVADYDSCQHCAAQIKADIGPVDILINNAGIVRDASFKKLNKVNWDAVIRTNLDSVFNMTSRCAMAWLSAAGAASSMCRRSSAPRVVLAKPTMRQPKRACTASRNRWRSKSRGRV